MDGQYELPNASATVDMHRADQPLGVASDATYRDTYGLPVALQKGTHQPGKSPDEYYKSQYNGILIRFYGHTDGILQ